MLTLSVVAAMAAVGLAACAGDLQGGPASEPQPSPSASVSAPGSGTPAPSPRAAPHAAATPAAAGAAPSASSCYQYPTPERTGKLVPCPGAP
jgi:hypothetical protein